MGVPSSVIDKNDVVPVVLAAGDSLRMGFPKALLPLGESTFVATILGKLRKLRAAVPFLILGREAQRIRCALPENCGTVLINQNPELGQLSSMRLAVENLPPSSQGCLFWPVDQPHVTAELVGSLIMLFCRTGAPIVLPRMGDRRGHPAIFHRDLFVELLSLPPKESPKSLAASYREDLVALSTNERAILEDIDTPEDYRLLTGETPESAVARFWGPETCSPRGGPFTG